MWNHRDQWFVIVVNAFTGSEMFQPQAGLSVHSGAAVGQEALAFPTHFQDGALHNFPDQGMTYSALALL